MVLKHLKIILKIKINILYYYFFGQGGFSCMLGDRIAILRKAKGISQVELANIIGVSKQSISNWENNNIMPSVEMVITMADYFGCSSDYLLELNEDKMLIETTFLTASQAAHIKNIVDDYISLNRKIQKLKK